LVVDPDVSLMELVDDCHMLLDTALRAVETMNEEASDLTGRPEVIHHWWPMVYLLRQALIVYRQVAVKAGGVCRGSVGPRG
jgi:hypothetical protein